MYGIVDGERGGRRASSSSSRLVEKPAPGTAPSRLAIIGRYLLPPEIFPILAETKPGEGGEIQLTDALATLCAQSGLAGLRSRGSATTSAIAPATSWRWCTTRSAAPTSPTRCAPGSCACWRDDRPT